ncbi:MAG: tetraacyldisaccharide 4'-kinase [Gemmatimonadaceae bacterium]
MSIVEDVWFGRSAVASAARVALWPLSVAYGLAVAGRNRLYDAGLLASRVPVLPVVSVGNLTVGGTGKTPVSAWIAGRLAERARTAVVLRGYGDDEVEVHARLNPAIPVVANADRFQAVREAQRRGAEIAVLDDAYQHRRIRPTVQVLLVSAEQLARPRRLLPAGPWREALTAARRAHLIVITRKSAGAGAADDARQLVLAATPGIPTTVVHLAPADLRSLRGGASLALERLRGAAVLAIAAIGEPDSFHRQLEALGAVVTMRAFRDHHAFSDAEMASLAAQAPADGLVVCTLKDAVKLDSRWPAPSRLWYLSQQLVVERGEDAMNSLLERALQARASAATFAG